MLTAQPELQLRYRASMIFQYITASASARQSSTWPRMHTIYSYHVTRRTKNLVLSYMGGSGCVTTASCLPPHISTVLLLLYYCFITLLGMKWTSSRPTAASCLPPNFLFSCFALHILIQQFLKCHSDSSYSFFVAKYEQLAENGLYCLQPPGRAGN